MSVTRPHEVSFEDGWCACDAATAPRAELALDARHTQLSRRNAFQQKLFLLLPRMTLSQARQLRCHEPSETCASLARLANRPGVWRHLSELDLSSTAARASQISCKGSGGFGVLCAGSKTELQVITVFLFDHQFRQNLGARVHGPQPHTRLKTWCAFACRDHNKEGTRAGWRANPSSSSVRLFPTALIENDVIAFIRARTVKGVATRSQTVLA